MAFFSPSKTTQETSFEREERLRREEATRRPIPTITPEEQELGRLEMERLRATQPGQIGVQQRGMDLISQILSGGQLPGFLGGLPGGISEEMIGGMAKASIKDLPAFFQGQGLLDSGVAPSIMGQVAGQSRLGSAQFNVQNLMNLLQMGITGGAQLQAPMVGQQGLLSQRLAGLRGFEQFGGMTQAGTTAGTQMMTSMAPNPFVTSLQQSLGKTLGGGFGGGINTALGF